MKPSASDNTASAHHVAFYNGRAVVIDYVPLFVDGVGRRMRARVEFNAACMRIQDNGASGFVATPKGELFWIEQGKRRAVKVAP